MAVCRSGSPSQQLFVHACYTSTLADVKRRWATDRVDADTPSITDRTPLTAAIRNPTGFPIVCWLVEVAGANVNRQGDVSQTPATVWGLLPRQVMAEVLLLLLLLMQ